MAKKKNNLPLLLAIGVLVSGIAVACSVKDDTKPTTDTPTEAHIMYRSIFINNIIGTYTPKNGAIITVGGSTMVMANTVTITSTKANDLYTINISTTDDAQTLKDIQFTENSVVNIVGINYTQKLDIVSVSKATLENVYLDLKSGSKEITSTDIYIENGVLTIFGTAIADKN